MDKKAINDNFNEFVRGMRQEHRDTTYGLDLYQGLGKVIVHCVGDDLTAVGRTSKDSGLEHRKMSILKSAISTYRLVGEVVIISDSKEMKVCDEIDLVREFSGFNSYKRVLYRGEDITGFPFYLHLTREDKAYSLGSANNNNSGNLGVGILEDCREEIEGYRKAMRVSNRLLKTKAIDILTIEGLNEILLTTGGQDTVQERLNSINFLKSVFDTLLLDDNTEFTTADKQLGGVQDIIEENKIALCSATSIPMSRLFGKTKSGMAYSAVEEMKNYNNLLSFYRKMVDPLLEYLDLIWGDKGEWNKELNLNKEDEIANQTIVNYVITLREKNIINDRQALKVLEKKGIV